MIKKEADIPVALIYTYFKNKEVLFDAVVSSVYINFESAFNEEESLEKGSASERFDEVGENYIHELLKERKKLIILMDKSSGTKHTEAKQKLISQMQIHIEVSLKRQSEKEYEDRYKARREEKKQERLRSLKRAGIPISEYKNMETKLT